MYRLNFTFIILDLACSVTLYYFTQQELFTTFSNKELEYTSTNIQKQSLKPNYIANRNIYKSCNNLHDKKVASSKTTMLIQIKL